MESCGRGEKKPDGDLSPTVLGGRRGIVVIVWNQLSISRRRWEARNLCETNTTT